MCWGQSASREATAKNCGTRPTLGRSFLAVTLRSMNLAVLVSGSGTLLEAMLAADLPVTLVVADRLCRGLEIAREHQVPAQLVERTDFGVGFDRDAYALSVLDRLRSHQIDLIAMAGFGTILGEPVFAAYPSSILNTHPALLPAFPGWHAVRDALDAGVSVTGCTVHIATPVVDAGPILAQESVDVWASDDEDTLHERIKVVERRLYVETLQHILERGSVLEPTTPESGVTT